ncbi:MULTISPECIES: hypothetical protein [unclassified Streptomyces]|uniref:hypothetical protein n=1 Tax=Streptomyces sp. NPDC059916 TaxID=3347001 RepID=UPI0036C25272
MRSSRSTPPTAGSACPARDPEHIGRLARITPGVRAVGLTITGDLRTGTASLRRGEPWFPSAFQALEAVAVGNATDEHSKAIAPFS